MQAIISEAVYVTMVISLIPMLAISLGAGLVALVQAVTQVQEQSMVHFARLVVMVFVLVWGGGHAFSELEALFVKVVGYAAQSQGG